MTIAKEPSTTMDEYSSWQYETGLTHILYSYDRMSLKEHDSKEFGTAQREMVTQTIDSNIIQLVNKYPETTFYLFYTPYNICYWDAISIEGTIEKQIDAERQATELLLQCPNVRLYNFFDQHEIIENLEYYNDLVHYSSEVNSMILQWMAEGTGQVTKENYLDKLDAEKQYYLNYDYNAIYE